MPASSLPPSVPSLPFAIALMGPTASGKTDLAINLAHQLNGEVVSVDSALVYKGLNIGAAKPSLAEQGGITHWMMDLRDPSEPYSVADFCEQARSVIADIIRRKKVPILAGGTMMYFKALLQGLSEIPESDPVIRQSIEKEAMAHGWPKLHAELAKVDALSASRMHPNHSQRIGRALEVWRSTGKPMSEWQTGFKGGLLEHYRWRQFALYPGDRAFLHQRIKLRFERMLEQGFIDEVRALKSRSELHKDLPAIRSVGYRQVWEYLDNDYSYDAMIEKGVAATRQLAKRQLTWLRSWEGLEHIDSLDQHGNMKDIELIASECLSFCPESGL